jgi:phosphodiesterase/alkaline phosphatase D-like protein
MRYFKNQLLNKKGVFIMKKNMFFFVSHYQKAKTMKIHIISLLLFLLSITIYPVYATNNPNIILGRPTDKTITVSIHSSSNIEVYLEYRKSTDTEKNQTDTYIIQSDIPNEILLENLEPDEMYMYQIFWRETGLSSFITGEEFSFRTQREKSDAFIFTVQADSHYGEPNFNERLYEIAIQNAAKDAPDFHIDLGDTFMTEKYARNSYDEVFQVALDHRSYFGIIGNIAPVFLVNGNHEGELGWEHDGTDSNLAIWSIKARQICYPNPVPDSFYSGSKISEPIIGIKDSFFSWRWGNALFVVLDPYWYTKDKPGNKIDNWGWTLGEEQYHWLIQTLENSEESFKFVFIHHLVGGCGEASRGGVECARYYEWGGTNTDETYGFQTHRPNWSEPIHDILVQNNVSIVFHGHDHVFVKQDLDGIVYQECPQPSNREYEKGEKLAAESGYVLGDVVNGSGHLRIAVSASKVQVDFIRAFLPEDENTNRKNQEIAYSYTIDKKGDLDKNGQLNMMDELLCLKVLAGMSALNSLSKENSLDTQTINLKDAIYIIKNIATSDIETRKTFPGNIILGRPTDQSVTVNYISDKAIEVFIEYATRVDADTSQTSLAVLSPDIPQESVLTNLKANTKYFYHMKWRDAGSKENFSNSDDFSFHTQKKTGNSFTFTIQADSHLGTDKHCHTDLYKKTLQNVVISNPDFHIDLGDTFRSSKLIDPSYEKVSELYLKHRPYFSIVSSNSPLFLVLGNHEYELGFHLDGTANNIPVWSTLARKLFYPNPEPDSFYKGNEQAEDFVGLRENYYAWEWGDALFVVLDPYWYTTFDPNAGNDFWGWTIGDTQYFWLKETLENSQARYKFVFIHHILGTCRGAIEWARYYEWGGYNKNEKWEFDIKRPGWSLPIHQLMVANNVSICFQGHDHIFVKQELDGIIYQTCPMPGDPTYTAYNQEYFLSGDTMPNSGHICVTVSGTSVKVDYIRAYLEKDEINGHVNGEIAYSYFLK